MNIIKRIKKFLNLVKIFLEPNLIFLQEVFDYLDLDYRNPRNNGIYKKC